MATPEDNNPLAEIQSSLAQLTKIPPSTLASGGVAAAAKGAAGVTPGEAPSGALAEITASLDQITKSTVPPLVGARPSVTGLGAEPGPTEGPVVAAPAGAPKAVNPLDEINASLAQLQKAPGAAPAPEQRVAVRTAPEEDITAPWSDRLSKRFHEAWNAPGSGVVGRTWGTINTPIISETDLEAWLGNPTEQAGSLFGGITKGVYGLLGGLTSPLSLGFILGTAGVGGLVEGGAAATLRLAGMEAGEIASVVKGSEVLAKSIKAGMTAKESLGAMELAGINSATVSKGLDILSKAGLTSHDLIRGGLIRTVGSAALRGVGMATTKAERVGQGIQLLIDGGFAAQNIYGAAVAFPSALDALKEGDTETAARLITEATGLAGFGLLGTKASLKEAGGMMDDFQVNMGLKVKPSEENMLLQREFGLADRQMTEAGRTHELWAEDMRKLYKTVTSTPDGPALVRNFVDAGGDEATMQRNYDLVLKSAGRQPVSPASLLTIQPEIAEAPRMRKTQATVIPKAAETVPLYESEKYPGGSVSQVFDSYHKAAEVLSDQNPYVRLSSDPVKSAKSTNNEGRTLLIQISSNLINSNVASAAEKLKEVADLDTVRSDRPVTKAGEAAAKPELTPDEIAVQYFDKLYSNTRPGYARLHDFWEIPDWIARASHFLPDADLYVVRSVEAAKKFLNDAKYDRVLFSALDVNRDIIKSILYSEDNKSGYSGRVDMGGYIDPAFFKDQPNVNWHDSLETMATAMGADYKPGVSYRHFQGSDTIPRLTLSEGCLHKCAFCVIANTALKLSPEDVVNQQVGEIAKLGAKLVYVNDKTFGQAKNYQDLAKYYEQIKKENPAFHGFAVQTTGAQLNKIPEEWLAKSGIKYVELGIESFNDPILKEMHKPATEQLINKGVDKLRRNGIALIPNIIIGYPGETAATYQHTMDFLVHNRDIISHANVYNLALYKDVELGKKRTTAADGDFNENILEKSWHTDPNVVKKFAGDLYGMLQQHLDQVPDVLQPLRPLSELTPTEIKQLSIGKRAEVFLNVLQQAPEVKELVAAAKAGSKGRDWYDRSIKAFDAMRELAPGYFKPEDADVFAGVLAATSPQQSVVMNMREALTFWKEWKDNGSPTTQEEILKLQRKKKITPITNQGSKLPNLLKAINRETMLPADKEMYYKVGNFARNLQDIFKDPSGTFDSWMGVFFGFDERQVPRASFYHAMAVQTRLAARELGWSPKQAQAAIWSFTKTLAESSGWKGSMEREKFRPEEVIDFMIPEDYSKYSKDFADLMHEDPEIRAKLHSMGVNVGELDKRLQAIPKPTPVEGANEAATSEILRRSAQRIGEAQQKLEGFGGYSEYFPGERFDFEREVNEAKPKTETPEFRNWFGESKLVDDEGKPVVMYHGTTTDFTEFSKRKGSPEGDWGAGFYFTNEPQDVNLNYAGEGPDLIQKLNDRAERIMDRTEEPPVGYGTPEYKARKQRALQQARKELGVQHGGAVLPTYIALKNPLDIGGPAEPHWDYKDIRKFLSGLRRAGSKVEDFRAEKIDVDRIEDMDGSKAGEILDTLWKRGEGLWYSSDAKGRLVGKEIVRKALESMGYDGILDRTVAKKFPNMAGMDQETFHAIAFKPEQVKSATGNLGTFDPSNPDIRREVAPRPRLPLANFMIDNKGETHQLPWDETHRQWIDRNFSRPEAGQQEKTQDFNRALEEGYIRVRNETNNLIIEASKLNPSWVRDVREVFERSGADKPVKLDTFQGGNLKQHHFDDPQEFRDWLNTQGVSREAAPRGWTTVEPRGFSTDAEGHPLAKFSGVETTALENLSPFVKDKLNRLGNQLSGINNPDTGQQVVGLFKNERGENTLVLAGKGFEALNRVLKGSLTDLNGASARAEATESMVNFLEKHPNQYIKDLAATLQPVKGEPLTFLMLTGPDPFATLLHEHVHGALSEAEVKAAHEAMSQLPGYDDALTYISGISGMEGRSYSSEAQIINELLPRLVAGQLYDRGIPEGALTNLTWAALNAISEQSAYEKILGNIHPDVRGKFDAYIHPERATTEGRPVSEQPAGTPEGRGQTQPRAVAGAAEQGRGRVQAGTEEPAPSQAELDQLVSEGLITLTKKVPLEAGSKMAEALQNVKITDGFTVNPNTGFVPRSEGFAVEALPERRQTLKHDVTIKDIEAFAAKNRVLLDEHPELFVGGYGKELNISTVLKTAEAAKEFGKRLDQEAVWDFAKGETLNLGGTGKKISFETFPLDERLKFARQNSINVEGPTPQIQRELGEAPRDTGETRLHELAAQQHIKKNYNEKEIDTLLRSYDPKRLTDQHRALAGDVKKHFTGNFERAAAGGALEEGLEHYVTHMWEKDANNPAANRLLADAKSGTFAVNTSMARHRTFNHAIEGQLLGRKLAVTDPIALAAHNGNTFDRVLAARKVLERLQDRGTRASDGRPMVALSGSGKLVQGPDGENEAVIVQADKVRSIRIAEKVVDGLRKTGDLDRLIKEGRIVKYGEVAPSGENSKGAEHYAWATHDYRSVSHPSFEGWQFASQDTNGNPVLVRGDLKVHPEAYDYVKRQIERQSPLAKSLKPVFVAGREAKGVLLSFDIFHLVQEGLRAVMTGVSPFGTEKWDLRTNPTLGKLVEHGLTMKDYGAIDSFQEGMMVGHSHLLGKIPVFGPASNWFQDYLFQKYLPSLKARAAEHLYTRYKKLYPEYGDEKVASLAAEDTNMRFGGLNLRREGRALATQDVFRLVALAPDWLESELRSMGRAMGGDGRVMRRDLAKLTVAMWLAARVLNQLNTGNPHYEAPFGVSYKDDEGRDKVISLRTLPTDMLHSITDPLKFLRYRFSPLERTVTTVYTGRDEQGRRLPARDLVWDILGDALVPLPLQNVTKKMSGFSPGESWAELGIRAGGAQVLMSKTDAQRKASELSADRTDSGPVDPDKLRAHAAKLEVEDRLRSGSLQPQELWQMVDQDLLSPKEAKGIVTNVNKTRGMEPDMAKLFIRSSRLPMADFLLVWEAATNAEKATLTPLMLKKKSSYFKKAFTEFSNAERQTDATYLKLRKLFPEQPPF